MPTRSLTPVLAALFSAALVITSSSAVLACSTGDQGGHGGPVRKPVTINKSININKPVTINKNINIEKNITINKSIVINKTGAGSAEATAFAAAMASANAGASANVNVYSGGYYEDVTVHNHFGGAVSGVHAAQSCQVQEASVVKAIHAVCVSPDGREFPASHMTEKTWVDSAFEGEIMRCIPGSRLKVTIGDMLQTDQGMAGTYASGQQLQCGEHEALRHFKGGVLKCAPAVPVPDCTERTNLRKFGTSDMFFSYRATVCASGDTATRENKDLDVTGMALEGGVGE